MVKRVPSKQSVHKDSLSQTPSFDRPRKKMNFKEIKKRSILAGLRSMQAPAVAWRKGGSDNLVKYDKHSFLFKKCNHTDVSTMYHISDIGYMAQYIHIYIYVCVIICICTHATLKNDLPEGFLNINDPSSSFDTFIRETHLDNLYRFTPLKRHVGIILLAKHHSNVAPWGLDTWSNKCAWHPIMSAR